LVEVYDTRTGAFAELTNISTRGFVGTGQNVPGCLSTIFWGAIAFLSVGIRIIRGFRGQASTLHVLMI
jgi:hypothetical protein